MVKFDADDLGVRPGIDLWRVAFAKEGPSAKGNNQFTLTLERCSDRNDQMKAWIPLQGNARFTGKKQLSAFLPAGFKGDVEAEDLIGTKVWVETVAETFKGTPQLKVKNRESVLRCEGFQHEDERPDCVPADDPELPQSGTVPMGSDVEDAPF